MNIIKEIPEYKIMNPTGNITALVTEPVNEGERAEIAAFIMKECKDVEQVGFLSDADAADIKLDMAGGEFCGNATMCAAVYHAYVNDMDNGLVLVQTAAEGEPVAVDVSRKDQGFYEAEVKMPRTLKVEDVNFKDGLAFPVVRFNGADHMIYVLTGDAEPDRTYFEKKIKEYAKEIGSLCVGMMFINKEKGTLTPLVYVPGADTLFWESSCAGGTTAAGAWMIENGDEKEKAFKEPGGILTVRKDKEGNIYLKGQVRF